MMPHVSTIDTEIIVAAILGTIITAGLFADAVSAIEMRFIAWSGHLTTKPRWFTIWLLIFFEWAVVRSLIYHRIDWDTITITFLWSGVPFFVENLLKSQNAAQMTLLTDLIVAIKEELDQSAERDEASAERDRALLSFCNRILDRLSKLVPEAHDRR